MKNKKLHMAIGEVRNIKMTDGERKHILKSVLDSKNPIKRAIKSPWAISSFVFRQYGALVYYGSLSCLIILLGGGVIVASARSLPGSIVYPIKVNILEPIRSVFLFSKEAKEQYGKHLETKRLLEAETLTNRNAKKEQEKVGEAKVDEASEISKNKEETKKESEKKSGGEKDEKKKDAVDSLIDIDKTSTDLNQTETETGTDTTEPSPEDKIKKDTPRELDNTEKLLEESGEKVEKEEETKEEEKEATNEDKEKTEEKKDNQSKADSKLLDYESSEEQADVAIEKEPKHKEAKPEFIESW